MKRYIGDPFCKGLIILMLLLIVSLYSFSQQREYVLTCGEDITKIVWTEERIDNKIYLQTKQGDETNEYIMSKSLQTERWSVKNESQRTDFRIEYRNDKYYITGILEGSDISKVVKSKGYVWFQNIAYNADFSLKGKGNIKFECFRPDDLKLFVMEAEHRGVNGDNANEVSVHLTGLLSKFWSCTYLFDAESSIFIKYRGVHGAPGTPETIITLSQ